MEIATEVATPEHAEAALNAGINYLWIGARTSANPIAVQAIADRICAIKKENDSLKGLCIKNPVNEDSALWLGNIERLEKTGVPVIAVHRGCGHKPCWAMAHAVRSARPDIPMLLDPSHMSGEASKIPGLLEKIGELSLNGAMIEVHCNPQEALSDSVQQIKPDELSKFLQLIEAPMTTPDSEATELNWLRAEIDETDDMLWKAVATRMDISRRIGEWKKAHHVAPLQPARFQQITERRSAWAAANGMDTEFIKQLLTIIHNESLKQQD
jgi:chorismate mutase